MAFEQLQPQEQRFGSNVDLPSVPEIEERAIVLFKPINATPLSPSPSNFSVSVSPDLISGLKSKPKISSSYRFYLVSFVGIGFYLHLLDCVGVSKPSNQFLCMLCRSSAVVNQIKLFESS